VTRQPSTGARVTRPRSARPSRGSHEAAPAPDAPRRLDTETRRRQLGEVAKRLFARSPFDQVKVEDVARAAGVSEALVFHYFPTKRLLYVAAVQAAADELAAALAPDPSLPPAQRLVGGIDAYLDFVEANPEGFRSVQEGGIGSDPEVRAIARRSGSLHVDRLVEQISAGAAAPEALRTAVRGWLGFLHAVALDWLERRSPPRDELRNLCVQVLVAAALVAWPQRDRPARARVPDELLRGQGRL